MTSGMKELEDENRRLKKIMRKRLKAELRQEVP